VEFSYRYGDAKEQYAGKVARRAFDMFETLQRELTPTGRIPIHAPKRHALYA
jgi:hypothetical protein